MLGGIQPEFRGKTTGYPYLPALYTLIESSYSFEGRNFTIPVLILVIVVVVDR